MVTFIRRSSLQQKRAWVDARGAELVEMAFMLPLLLTLLVGIFWAARAYNIYETITRAAREGARAAVANSCSSCGNATPSNSVVRTVVNNSLAASSVDPTKVKNTFSGTCPNGQSCDCPSNDICIVRNVPLNTSTPQQFGVSVSVTYPFQFNLPFTPENLATINISTTVQMRQE
jgi:Flp pilus assembly protein TadG